MRAARARRGGRRRHAAHPACDSAAAVAVYAGQYDGAEPGRGAALHRGGAISAGVECAGLRVNGRLYLRAAQKTAQKTLTAASCAPDTAFMPNMPEREIGAMAMRMPWGPARVSGKRRLR